MASIKSVGFTAPKFNSRDGRARFLIDKVALTANPTAADTLDFMIPGGVTVCSLEIQADDLDTNGAPTFVFGAGYAPVNPASALAANATYFAPVGRTTAQSGGRLTCSFKPIKFEEDVYLRLTVGTASATFAAGEIHAIAGVNCDGFST
jgi:hypothetical protein